MNVYHNALLTWSFQKALNCTKVDNVLSSYEELNEDLAWTHRSMFENVIAWAIRCIAFRTVLNQFKIIFMKAEFG